MRSEHPEAGNVLLMSSNTSVMADAFISQSFVVTADATYLANFIIRINQFNEVGNRIAVYTLSIDVEQ